MSTPLTDQLRAYFDDVDRHQGAVDVDALRRSVEEGVILIEVPLTNNALPPNGPTTGRRWILVAAAAVVVVVIVGAVVLASRDHDSTGPVTNQPLPATEGRGDRSSMSGFNRVWPEGATPRGPVTGELVVSVWASQGGWRFVYADGRLIWTPHSGGFQEQRLSPEGVDLVRAEIIATGLFNPDRPPPASEFGPAAEFGAVVAGRPVAIYGDIRARIGDRLVYIPRRPGEEWTSEFDRLSAKLMDLKSWLPPSAWQNREPVAYAPSHYAVCMWREGIAPLLDEPSSIETLLPAPAGDLLAGARRWTPEPWEHVPGADSQHCVDLTTEGARGLAEVLNMDIQRWQTSDLARVGSHRIHVRFLPYMPHGEIECACYGIG